MDQILLVNSRGIRKFDWKSLQEASPTTLESIDELPAATLQAPLLPGLAQLSLERPRTPDPTSSIERPFLVNGAQVVFDTSPDAARDRTYISERKIMVAEIPNGPSRSSSVRPIRELVDHCVNRLIGCFNGHVVFLDRSYCFCTWDVRAGSRSLKRHFYLPKDWLSPDMLKLCTVNASRDGALPQERGDCGDTVWDQVVRNMGFSWYGLK